ncbi:haloacid dehalogenase-like hydrolase [Bermanella marisrubri]|uniref:Phosphoserine phosphatase n=1 Tax=Bermanella marisrubri TaxID=207949 RepID=Q1N4G1_9GAMM|nr:haloacid dehalogenase-like hydrolase [Bermanella marisrubri]EAT13142.1 hypothetical protein RED65_00240 [Oceanobacter sp. RED65] [Bermanella marisrubri]QIZ83918.1 haloacid dehalogenase-like hydrolase [Bermanella marisrubri]
MSIFDICGTLYSCNTTFEFCKWRERRLVYRSLLWLTKTLPLKAGNRLIEKFFAIDLIRVLHLRTLKGCSESEIEISARRFVKEVLADFKVLPVHQILESKDLSSVVLVSATIEPVAKAIAEYLGVPSYLASTLCIKKGRYDGEIKNDLLGNKHSLFKGVDIDLVVTDNKSDYLLCKQAREVVIVSKRANMQYWKEKSLTNLSLIEV